MWNLKTVRDEFICKADTEAQMYRTNVWIPRWGIGGE